MKSEIFLLGAVLVMVCFALYGIAQYFHLQ